MSPRRETPRDDRDRDQGESAFTAILGDLVARVPGAQAAAIVDTEGETVDYAGNSDPFSLRVTAAHWRIVLQHANERSSLGRLRWLAVRSAQRSYLIQALPQGYALVVALTRGVGLARWQRAMATCCSAICREAGWVPEQSVPDQSVPEPDKTRRPDRSGVRTGARVGWFRVDIIMDELRRPTSIRVGEAFHSLEILGSIVGLRTLRTPSGSAPVRVSARGARAWRVRLEGGVEVTVRRGADGTWFADEPLDSLERPSSRVRAPTKPT